MGCIRLDAVAVGFDVEEEIGVIHRGVGVVRTAVCIDEILVFGRIGIFRSAQEQHVLQKVRQTLTVGGVVSAAGLHAEAGSGLVRSGVGDQHDTQVIGQFEVTILTLVEFAAHHGRRGLRGDGAGCQHDHGKERQETG